MKGTHKSAEALGARLPIGVSFAPALTVPKCRINFRISALPRCLVLQDRSPFRLLLVSGFPSCPKYIQLLRARQTTCKCNSSSESNADFWKLNLFIEFSVTRSPINRKSRWAIGPRRIYDNFATRFYTSNSDSYLKSKYRYIQNPSWAP